MFVCRRRVKLSLANIANGQLTCNDGHNLAKNLPKLVEHTNAKETKMSDLNIT